MACSRCNNTASADVDGGFCHKEHRLWCCHTGKLSIVTVLSGK